MDAVYRFVFIDPWPFWLGGLCIGFLVPGLYYFLNTPLGVSTGYGSYLKLLFPKSKLRWLNSKTFAGDFDWRILFLLGILIGAFFSARMSGKPFLTEAMGLFTQRLSWPLPRMLLWFFTGGLLLGLGSRLAGGCTSGHSIHGLANLHLSSLIATVFFLIFGVLTVYGIRVLWMGGV
ncbi:MAG TPA: hypothetical protein DIT32_05800 [Peptococcaceae bacterium]|nr:hypothetical protein [Peptococcaceae bacterium]